MDISANASSFSLYVELFKYENEMSNSDGSELLRKVAGREMSNGDGSELLRKYARSVAELLGMRSRDTRRDPSTSAERCRNEYGARSRSR